MNSTLQKLELWNNIIKADGALALVEALHVNTTLMELNLNSNCIGDYGALAIADVLCENSTLQTLNLRCNYIEDDVKKVLRESWGNRVGTLEI